MIIKNMRKVLSSVIIAAYLVVYAAPMGLCITSAPQIQAGVQKPALRSSANPISLKLEGDISLTKGNPKISLSLRDSDVRQVLRMFADKAGLNIIFHESVGSDSASSSGSSASSDASSTASSSSSSSTAPKVTLDLVNVPLNDAFRMVMQVTNLTYYIDHNTMVVMAAEAAKTLNMSKQEMMTIPVKYVDASTLATFLNKNIFSINKPGLSNAEIAVTNPSTNDILIFGTKNDYSMAKKVVEQFDVKPKEEVFVVNHTTPKEMSELICNNLFKDNSGSGSSGSSSSSSSSTGGAAGISGNPTGFAADSSSSSGSGSDIALGTGIIACQPDNTVSAGSLASLGTSSLSITYFPQRGTISAMGGSAQQMEMIRDFIQKNDKKQPQAYLEVSIIELNESGMREFDNTWQIWSKYFSGSFNGTTATNPYYPNFVQGDQYSVLDTAKNKFAPLYDISKFAGTPTITYSINYLIQNQKGRVLANPRIMITNGQASSIDLSSDYVKSVQSQYLTGTLSNQVNRTYNIASDEGIKVDLMPFISPEGYVTLNIKPVYSTVKEKVYGTSSDGSSNNDLQATLLQRRNLDLKNVRIKDGETLVIGGMVREDETKNVSKIPVLGDVPGIGMFFRNTGTTKTKQELVIMITPKIIKDSEDVVSNPGVTL